VAPAPRSSGQSGATGEIGLARYAGWWGSPLGLGPALDTVRFRAAPDEPERLRRLLAGEVEVANGLSPPTLAQVEADPLLTTVAGGLGLERSVRGIKTAKPFAFSGVWLTTVAGG
jgi:ABC-type transport system substrate-binding protein